MKNVPDDDGSGGYELSAAVDSAHKRIVWSVHFCPNAPDVLASGSRDGLIKVWRVVSKDGSLEMNELHRYGLLVIPSLVIIQMNFYLPSLPTT